MIDGTKTAKLEKVVGQSREATMLQGLLLAEGQENLPININA